ncbi:MAG: hypothetical protein ACI9H6_000456 [Patiriisocius sp.]|jgi:hypothetical protein
MSSLRFTKPLQIKGLPKEVESEWEGLIVGLASAFPFSIGCIDTGPARIWDDKKEVYRCDGPFEHDPQNLAHAMMDKCLWISHVSLTHACKYSSPRRPGILVWLESEEGKQFRHFQVSEGVAEYLP